MEKLNEENMKMIELKLIASDDSNLYPLFKNKGYAAKKAIRKLRKYLDSGALTIDTAYEYELALEHEVSSIVNK